MVFLFTPDEEIGSPTTRGVIEDIGRQSAAVLVTEPAREGGKIVTARKGVGRFEVKHRGPARPIPARAMPMAAAPSARRRTRSWRSRA
jgi:acetylornithine deacetylase/succinyl-diaminopimelate desuccinylase-like protein